MSGIQAASVERAQTVTEQAQQVAELSRSVFRSSCELHDRLWPVPPQDIEKATLGEHLQAALSSIIALGIATSALEQAQKILEDMLERR